MAITRSLLPQSRRLILVDRQSWLFQARPGLALGVKFMSAL
jgi:hypothetical protein